MAQRRSRSTGSRPESNTGGRAGSSQTTTDHETIRRWVEERGGKPVEVAATAGDGQTGILRIDFPGFSGEGALEPIPWEQWFEKFDGSGLAFVFQETTKEGQRSNFNKLVSRETASARASGRRGGKSSRAASGRGTASARGRKATPSRSGSRPAQRREAARTTSSRRGTARKAGTKARGGARGGTKGRSGTTRKSR